VASQPTVIVTDIEGTTTPVTFVTEVLFPYARDRLPAYVSDHASEPAIQEILDQTRAEAASPTLTQAEVIETLIAWIDEDRKATPLKTLQGLIWRDGYRAGGFTAPLYADVAPTLRAWHASGIRLCVYSSGSVEAQELLFRYSSAGDLTPLFEDYFDTRVGAKNSSASYESIARMLGCKSSSLLFLSDSPAEVTAASQASWRTVRIDRALEATSPMSHGDEGLVAPGFAAVASWLQD
jgi:enolase-phosphatase E1